jgi:hypothetical protein
LCKKELAMRMLIVAAASAATLVGAQASSVITLPAASHTPSVVRFGAPTSSDAVVSDETVSSIGEKRMRFDPPVPVENGSAAASSPQGAVIDAGQPPVIRRNGTPPTDEAQAAAPETAADSGSAALPVSPQPVTSAPVSAPIVTPN